MMQGGKDVMKHFYEMFLSANEKWAESSIMINMRKRKGKKKVGKYVWKKLETLKEQSLGP